MPIVELDPEVFMMATQAIHVLGDISRDKADLCIIYREEEDSYIGIWATGFGFFDVKFPKTTTRELSLAEKAYFGGKVFSSGLMAFKVPALT